MSLDRYHSTINMGNNYFSENKLDSAIEYYSQALTVAEMIDDTNLQFQVREKIARSYYKQGKVLSSLRHLNVLIPYAKGDTFIKLVSLETICYGILGQYDKAIRTICSLALHDSPLSKQKLLVNLGVIYIKRAQHFSNQDDLVTAIKLFKKALKITTDCLALHKINKNIGITYNLLGMHKESIEYFEKSLQLANNHSYLVNNAYHEMVNSYIMLGQSSKAKELLKDSFSNSLKNKDHYQLGLAFQQYGHLKFKEGSITQGEKYLHKSINCFLKINSYTDVSESYRILRDYFRNIDQYKYTAYEQDYNRYLHKHTA